MRPLLIALAVAVLVAVALAVPAPFRPDPQIPQNTVVIHVLDPALTSHTLREVTLEQAIEEGGVVELKDNLVVYVFGAPKTCSLSNLGNPAEGSDQTLLGVIEHFGGSPYITKTYISAASPKLKYPFVVHIRFEKLPDGGQKGTP